jgi:hypothetical protein
MEQVPYTSSIHRVADPHQLNADPDPAFHFNVDPDPDPAFYFNADPGLHFEPLGLHCECPKPYTALFRATKASEFWL